MKLSSIKALPRTTGRPQRKGAMSGGYNWELGDLAFGNPISLIGKSAKARAKARETWNDTGKKRRAKKSESSDYHQKHGDLH